MIEIIDTKNQRIPNICRTCGNHEHTKDIRFSLDGDGSTVITLCNNCIIELIDKLNQNVLMPIPFICGNWNSSNNICRLINATCIKGMNDFKCERLI